MNIQLQLHKVSENRLRFRHWDVCFLSSATSQSGPRTVITFIWPSLHVQGIEHFCLFAPYCLNTAQCKVSIPFKNKSQVLATIQSTLILSLALASFRCLTVLTLWFYPWAMLQLLPRLSAAESRTWDISSIYVPPRHSVGMAPYHECELKMSQQYNSGLAYHISGLFGKTKNRTDLKSTLYHAFKIKLNLM